MKKIVQQKSLTFAGHNAMFRLEGLHTYPPPCVIGPGHIGQNGLGGQLAGGHIDQNGQGGPITLLVKT